MHGMARFLLMDRKKKIGFLIVGALLLGQSAFAITVSDMRTILNDKEISAYLEKNELVQIDRLGDGMVAACGRNSMVLQKVVFLKRGEWTEQELNFKIQAADGNCMGNAPRRAFLVE